MYGVSFRLFCLFSFVLLNRVHSEEGQAYNVHRLYQRFHSSLSLKEKYPILAKSLSFGLLDNGTAFEALEHLLQNSSKCLKDISYTFESLGDFSNPWALKILDSFAKPPESGILQGNFKWVGDYNECVDVYAPPNAEAGDFRGQYCSLSYALPLLNHSFPLTFGICLPDSCSPQDLRNEVMLLLLKAGGFPVWAGASAVMNNLPLQITCTPREHPLNAAAISVIALLCVFFVFALLGSSLTAAKYFKKLVRERKGASLLINISRHEEIIIEKDGKLKNIEESEDAPRVRTENVVQTESSNKGFLDSCETFLGAFCVFTNGAKLLNTDSSEGQLLCIHGIRFLSMTWVILGHSYAMGVQDTRNVVEMIDTVKDDFAFQIVLQGFFSVDSFFTLSGFLLTYLYLKEISKRKGSMNWIYFYVHRYLRLTPIYMVLLAFSATVFFYLGSGPFWPAGDYDPICKKHWWWNLLYINNFNEAGEQCMAWSWYLANDMQFFIISPLFLITLWRWPKIGYGLIGLSVVSSMLCSFLLTYYYDLVAGMASFINTENLDMATALIRFSDYFQKLYIKPYTRIIPYLIGMLFGHLVFKHQTSNRPKLHLGWLCLGWTVATAVTLAVVYGLYDSLPSLVARSIYSAFNRLCFASSLAWVIYVCLTDQGGVVNSILSFKLFIPLSRLTYSAYLIHPMILTAYFNSLKLPFEFSHPSLVLTFLGFIVVTYALALPVSLLLESPIVSLEKLIRNKFNAVQKTESSS